MKILYRSDSFIAILKSAGTLSVPARAGFNDPRPVAGLELESQLSRKVYPVHRLDLEVSGLLLFALNAEAHRMANLCFERRLVRKTYEALSEGALDKPMPCEFEWKSLLVRGKKRAFEAPHGKRAVTKARCLSRQQSYLYWNLEPLTGRSHQLRFEMAKHGFVIQGDKLYGASSSYPQGIALHSWRLDFSECLEIQKAFSLPAKLEAPSILEFPT